MKVDARESARRQHRKIALFCVIYSWLRNADGVYLSYIMLNRLIGLERIRKDRIDWIKEDFREYFSYIEVLYEDESEKTLRGIKFSKCSFNYYEPDDEVEILYLDPTHMMKLGNLFRDGTYHNSDEMYVSCILALLSQGQIAPKGIFAGEEKNL